MPRKTDAGNPQDWLFLASYDLDALQVLIPRQIAFPVCRSKLAEGLEKLLKADLIAKGWRLRKIHDLQALREDLEELDPRRAEDLRTIVDALADSYVETRYPGFDLADEDWPRLQELLTFVEQYRNDLQKRL